MFVQDGFELYVNAAIVNLIYKKENTHLPGNLKTTCEFY